MILSINAERIFKNTTPILDKKKNKLRIQGNFLNLIKKNLQKFHR